MVESLLPVDAVEDALELLEEGEGRFPHQLQHLWRGVLRCHLQAATYVVDNQFAGILACSLIDGFVLAVVQYQVVAHATAYEALLDAGQGIYGMVDVQQWAVVSVQVGTDGRMDA